MPARRLKVMVSSTIYGWEDQVEQIAGTLDVYGYHVLNSHIGTIAPTAGLSNFQACLEAVTRCDYFLGIIRGYYGSGRPARSGLADDEIGITHMEQRRAIQLDKPRAFLVEEKVVNARQLLRPLLKLLRKDPFVDRVPQWDLPLAEGERNPLEHNPVIDDLRILAMYEEALLSEQSFTARHDHWCQSFHRLPDVLRFLETRFADRKKLRAELRAVSATPRTSRSRP